MRRSFSGVARGLLVLSVVLVLGTPAEARQQDGERGWRLRETPIVKMIKKLVVKTFGDGLTDPKP